MWFDCFLFVGIFVFWGMVLALKFESKDNHYVNNCRSYARRKGWILHQQSYEEGNERYMHYEDIYNFPDSNGAKFICETGGIHNAIEV